MIPKKIELIALLLLLYHAHDKFSIGFIIKSKIRSKCHIIDVFPHYQRTKVNYPCLCLSSQSATMDSTESQLLPPPQERKGDNRPHEQRVKQPRKARRLNHSFMHLYRHDDPRFDDQQIAPSSKSLTCAKTYLMEYGSLRSNVHEDAKGIVTEDLVMQMSQNFPPLLELDVKRHLRPKMRFLKYTLGCEVVKDTHNKDIAIRGIESIPPQFFGARLEKVIAPRHAFLVSKGLPHGEMLLQNDAELFRDFLISCRRLKSFCALCNQWKKKYGTSHVDLQYQRITIEEEEIMLDSSTTSQDTNHDSQISPNEVDAFDSLFVR